MPPELREKFDLLDKPLGFNARTKLLAWFVDSMRSSVLNHFESSDLLQEMESEDKVALLN